MRRERNTLVGTPTVMAPGCLFLVGDLGLPEEEVAVLAALSSHATAQYLPHVEPRLPLVADAVERARAILGEASAALPEGSVLLAPAKSPKDDDGAGFDKSAAVAVATTAAVFELAGQPIAERGFEILTVADAAYRTAHDGAGGEGELAAALHGGLIKVLGRLHGAPRIERLSLQPGFSVVVFQTGAILLSAEVLASMQTSAADDRSAREDLLEQAAQFASSLSHRDVVAAIASGRRYGQALARLAGAASPPGSPAQFNLAAQRAEEMGGAAIPSRAGRGDIGVAIFATPEAATMFTRACRPPLKPLRLALDRDGARVVGTIEMTEATAVAATVVRTPMPEADSYAPAAPKSPSPVPMRSHVTPSGGAIVQKAVEDITTQRKVASAETVLLPSAPPSRVVAIKGSPSPDMEGGALAQLLRPRPKWRPMVAAALVFTAAGAIWWAWPGAESRRASVPKVRTERLPLPVAPTIREPAVAVQPVPVPAESPPAQVHPEDHAENPQAHATSHAPVARAHASLSGSGRRVAIARAASMGPVAAPMVPATRAVTPPKPTPESPPHSSPTRKARAGKLTADDF